MAQIRWLAAGFVAGVILVVMVIPQSSVSTPAVHTPVVGLDKWLHLIAYATLAFVLGSALQGRPGLRAWIGATAYGVALELLQLAIPYRAFSLGDVAANVIGAAVGVCLWYGSVVLRRHVRAS